MEGTWKSIQDAIDSAWLQFRENDTSQLGEEERPSKFESMCSVLKTHDRVVLDVTGLNQVSVQGYLKGKFYHVFDVDLRGNENAFLSAVADSPGLEQLTVSRLERKKDKKDSLLEAAGRNQNLQDLSISHPELFVSPVAQFLKEKRNTPLTTLKLHFSTHDVDFWVIERVFVEPTFPLFRPIVRAAYATLLHMAGAEIARDADTRCRNLAEGILAAAELNHLELGKAGDISDIYLCSVLEIVGSLPRLCSLTLYCRKERHIEILTVVMKSSKSLTKITLEGEACGVLDRCNTGTIGNFFDSLIGCRSLRELHLPCLQDRTVDGFVFHLIRLVNQHVSLVVITCRFGTIDATRQFCSSVESSVLERLTIHLSFETKNHYPEYCRMLAELLSQLPTLKHLSFRHGHEYEYGLDRSEEEGVFRAVRAHQTLTCMSFDHKLASCKLHDFGEYCNLQRKMADLRACPLYELLGRFAALKSQYIDMSGYEKYDLGLSIIYGFLRQRDDWFGIDRFSGTSATVRERSESDEAE